MEPRLPTEADGDAAHSITKENVIELEKIPFVDDSVEKEDDDMDGEIGKKCRKDKIREWDAVRFLRENFSVKECTKFVCKPHDDFRLFPPGMRMGSTPGDQSDAGGRNTRDQRFMRRIHGRIVTNHSNWFCFCGAHRNDHLHYVRVGDDSDMERVMEMMISYWHLAYPVRPELVVSVVGGGKLFRLSDIKQKEIFNRGLIRSIHTTRGWLLTSGCHMGVARAVGAAVKEGQSLEWYEDGRLTRTIHCIGVAPWGLIRNRRDLINSDIANLNDASYYVGMNQPVEQRNLPSLDASHSHFLLVDDGYRNREKGTARFRAALEKQLAAPVREGGMEVPVVVLMVEGGANSVEHVLESVLNEIPVLVCAGTGRAADILADSVARYSSIEQNPDDASRVDQLADLKHSVEQGVRKLYPRGAQKKPDTYFARLVDNVFAICERHQFISVFRFEQRSDLDLAILNCMMDSSKMNLNQQLHLALAWDRPDCAAERLQDDVAVLPRSELYYLLTEALVNNQTEFCRVLLDYGWSIKRFLTVARLRELYNRTVSPASHLWPLMGFKKTKKKEGGFPVDSLNLSHVYNVVKYCTRRFHHPLYSGDHWKKDKEATKLVFEKPFEELILWAVLVCREEMALFLWDYLVETPLTTSLVGTILCEVLGEDVNDFGTGIKSRYGELKSRHLRALEERAVGLVNQAFSANREKTLLLVQRPCRAWGNLDALALSALAFDKEFLSTACCQHAIFKIWKRGFDSGATRIVSCTFTVLPVLWLISFDDDQDVCPNGRCPPGACTCSTTSSRPYGGGAMDFPDGPKRANTTLPVVAIRAARPPYVSRTSNSRPGATPGDVANGYSAASTAARNLNMKRQSLSFGPSLSVENQMDSSHCGEEIKIVQRVSWIKKLLTFYSAPVVKFTNHTNCISAFCLLVYCWFLLIFQRVRLYFIAKKLWYILYLILYCFVILFDFRPDGPSFLEWGLYAWQLTFALEEVRDLLTYPGDNFVDKAEDYWYFSSFGTWNRIDVLSLLMSGLAFSLRWHPSTFPVARLLMAVTLIVYIVRLFKVYFVNSYLGPKVVMLKRMSWDLAMFLMVVVVFLVSYSVASQALLKQHKGFYWGVFYDLFLQGIWEIFGELNDSEMEGVVEGCPVDNSTWNTECSLRSWPVPVMLALYLFFGNILMINMLIAIFTHVFDEIQQNSEQIWKYEMYFLVEEFKKKPLLPAPFIVLEHVYLLGKWLRRSCKTKSKDVVIGGRKMEERELEFLEIFEKVCRSDFIDNRKRTESSKLENMIVRLQESVNNVTTILSESGSDTYAKMSTSESQQLLRSLHNSMDNLRKMSGDI